MVSTVVRPDWDTVHQNEAILWATRGTCKRLQVGGVFVRDQRTLVTCYNGAPSGQPHCLDVGCDLYWYGEGEETYVDQVDYSHDQGTYSVTRKRPKELSQRCGRAIHAEVNGVGYAARNGIALQGSTLYTWPVGPCHNCELLLVTIGIKAVVFPDNDYSFYMPTKLPLLQKAGIEVRIFNGKRLL